MTVLDPFVPQTGLWFRTRPMRNPIAAGDQRNAKTARARNEIRYRMRAKDGSWLHMSGHGRTRELVYAWIGFRQNLLTMFERQPSLRKQFRIERVEPERKGDVWMGGVLR